MVEVTVSPHANLLMFHAHYAALGASMTHDVCQVHVNECQDTVGQHRPVFQVAIAVDYVCTFQKLVNEFDLLLDLGEWSCFAEMVRLRGAECDNNSASPVRGDSERCIVKCLESHDVITAHCALDARLFNLQMDVFFVMKDCNVGRQVCKRLHFMIGPIAKLLYDIPGRIHCLKAGFTPEGQCQCNELPHLLLRPIKKNRHSLYSDSR